MLRIGFERLGGFAVRGGQRNLFIRRNYAAVLQKDCHIHFVDCAGKRDQIARDGRRLAQRSGRTSPRSADSPIRSVRRSSAAK